MIGTAVAIAFWVALALVVRHETIHDGPDCTEPMVTITTAPDSVPVIYEEQP